MKPNKSPFLLLPATAIVLWVLLAFWVPAALSSPATPFPEYECIKPNVAFWKNVYTKYSTNQGVIHDSDNLSIIYEVIELEDRDRRGAARRNKNKIKQAKRKYEHILARLASGNKPASAEEKRVLALFGPEPSKAVLREAKHNVRFQLGQKDKFREGLVRSGAYVDKIKKILKSYGVPEDLAYLPHVESSFNYKAYSKFGAAGIWQFTHSTGRRFMAVDYTLDERRDPISATHAAAKLLKENYEKLGDWPLAITAYNHGANGMLKAKHSRGCYEEIFKEYESRLFKFASRNFYSEFLAARDIARNYRQYFGNIELDQPVRFHEVKMAGYAPVDDLIQYFKVDLGDFRELNPGLRGPVYGGQKYVPKGYMLRLPNQEKIVKLAANIPNSLYARQQKRSNFYVVQRGDTAGRIARIHGVTVNELILANQLNRRATIYVGQNLRIPATDEKIIQLAATTKKQAVEKTRLASLTPEEGVDGGDEQDDATQEQDEMEVVSVEPTEEPQAPETPQSPVVPPAAKPKRPIIKLAMASSHGASSVIPGKTTVSDNGGTGYAAFRLALLSSRDHMVEETSTADDQETQVVPNVNPAVVTGHLKVERLIETPKGLVGTIRVEAEETLGHYAEWLGVRAWDIRRLNGFRYGQAIRVDQTIKIPLNKMGRERFEEQRYEYHKEIEEDFFAAYRVDSISHYRIKRGDNIWTLCQEGFELPLWLIKKYNSDVDFSSLHPEQELIIPVVEATS